MNRIDQTINLFSNNHNCSQSILMTFGPDLDLPVELAQCIAAPFGAGIGYQGEVCGAVTGGIMVLGLLAGSKKLPLLEEKNFAYSMALEFLNNFRSQCGSIMCRELLGYDISTPENLDQVKKSGNFEAVCPRFVQTSAELLIRMIERNSTNR